MGTGVRWIVLDMKLERSKSVRCVSLQKSISYIWEFIPKNKCSNLEMSHYEQLDFMLVRKSRWREETKGRTIFFYKGVLAFRHIVVNHI